MFIFKLNSFMDRYDPYWYGRLLALKMSYITIGLFIANLLLHPPMPSLIMILSGGGILLCEMPQINDLHKKDSLYLGYIILVCLTVGLFSSYIYLKEWFILVFGTWMYILYFLLRKKTELFAVVNTVLMIALISLEGFNSGNFFKIANTLMFVLEFALIVFWLHKLFPKLYYKIWLSAIIRNLEHLAKLDNSPSNTNLLFKDLQIANHSLPLIANYRPFADKINNHLSYYSYYLINLYNSGATKELKIIQQDLRELEYSIKKQQPFSIKPFVENTNLTIHYKICMQLHDDWNQLCEIVNS